MYAASPANLPQLNSTQLFLTDSGLETTLVFHHQLELPCFAAFALINDKTGQQILRDYYEQHAAIAVSSHCGFVLESPTWRANKVWADQLGYNSEQLAQANRDCVALMQQIRQEYEVPGCPMVISGAIGPHGDGYQPTNCLSAEQARDYHQQQVNTLAEAGVDMISAATLNYVDEAIGIALAARKADIPVVISFTTETDGKLPGGCSLREAIAAVDAATYSTPAYYMINCAHPDHFSDALAAGESWVQRIRGIRANASRLSHAELDEAEVLDDGNPQEFGSQYAALRRDFPQFNVLGGCCGTDHRHVSAICTSCQTH